MPPYVPPPHALRIQDRDDRRRSGGASRAAGAGTPVGDLQRALVAAGAATFEPDGQFGPQTQAALRRFQWSLSRLRVRLDATGQAVPYAVSPLPEVTGILDAQTAAALAEFVQGAFRCAGPLVRVDFAGLDRLRPHVGFAQLLPGWSCMLADRDFYPTLVAMNAKAAQEGLTVYVNQAFRVEGVPVTGAVVQPASRSAHKIGRAIDLQLGEGAALPGPSSAIAAAGPTSPIGRFRDGMIAAGCRWGGTFAPPDNPHFDRQLLPTSGEEWRHRFWFAQRQYSAGPGSAGTRIPGVG